MKFIDIINGVPVSFDSMAFYFVYILEFHLRFSLQGLKQSCGLSRFYLMISVGSR